MIGSQLEMFAQNIRLLIGILMFLGILVIVILGSWTGINFVVFRRRRHAAEREFRSGRFRADGSRLPPRGRGVCQSCGAAGDFIYYLTDGGRLCDGCYTDAGAKPGAIHS